MAREVIRAVVGAALTGIVVWLLIAPASGTLPAVSPRCFSFIGYVVRC